MPSTLVKINRNWTRSRIRAKTRLEFALIDLHFSPQFIKTTSRQSLISLLFDSWIHLTFFPDFSFFLILFFLKALGNPSFSNLNWSSEISLQQNLASSHSFRRHNIFNPQISVARVTFMKIRIRIKLFVVYSLLKPLVYS